MNPELKYEEKLSRRGFFRITAQIALGFVGLSTISFVCGGEEALTQMKGETMSVIMLPKPMIRGKISLEEAINKRRSERTFRDVHLTAEDLSQILWAAQGKTDPRRTQDCTQCRRAISTGHLCRYRKG